MRGAGILSVGGPVSDIDLPDPRPLADDEVLIAVRAAGVADWDEIVRQGGWDVGIAPPMALGVEAAGVVTAVGAAVDDWAPGDEVEVRGPFASYFVWRGERPLLPGGGGSGVVPLMAILRHRRRTMPELPMRL